MATQRYQQASEHLLAQARGELASGDVRQASEKGWGAAAQIVKAIAERRGWDHQGHRQLFEAVNSLRRETGDPDVRRLFDVASAPHTNFYEDWRTRDSVSEAIDDVELFVGKLEPLLNAWRERGVSRETAAPLTPRR